MSSMMQMINRAAAKRPFGVLGLDKAVHQTGKKVRQLIGPDITAGRHSPVFPQSIVTTKAVMSLPPATSDPNPSMDSIMAPLGRNQEEMIPKRGEWACRMMPNDYAEHAPLSVGRFADNVVFTCANGVPMGYNLRFAGIVTNAQDLLDGDRDDVGGLDIGGTVSGVNMGPDTAYPGDRMYIGLPWMLRVGADDSTLTPAVCIPGAPTDKAYFGTYVLRWNSVATAVNEVKLFLEEQYARSADKANFCDENILSSELQMNKSVRAEMPLYDYALIHAHQIRMRDVPNDAVALAAYVRCLHELDLSVTRTLTAYDQTAGYTVTRPRAEIHSVNAAAVKPTDHGILQKESERLKEMALGRMEDFMRQRFMGVVLTTSEPGQQLDLLEGTA